MKLSLGLLLALSGCVLVPTVVTKREMTIPVSSGICRCERCWCGSQEKQEIEKKGTGRKVN